jgi:FkbM family methyltransferase
MIEQYLNDRGIEIREGWFWPKKDKHCWPFLQNEKDLPLLLSKKCKNNRTVIQAGGNAGFYPKHYAAYFGRVITIEPDSLNFLCLNLNAPDDHVIKIQACVGYDRNTVSLTTSLKNAGAHHVSDVVGQIPTIRIDDLNCNDCDLIHLDIEGFELFALKGAEETIKRCRPVIVLEWLDHGVKYNAPLSAVTKLLNSMGYTENESLYHDKIFLPKD